MNQNSHLLRIFVLLILMTAVPAAAQQPAENDPTGDAPAHGDVRQPFSAQVPQSFGNIDNAVITARSFRQIFEAYLFPQGPVFITGDAVLQAFHVLLAQSLGRFEQAGSPHLLQALRLMRQQVTDEEPDRKKPGTGPDPGSHTGLPAAPGPSDSGYQDLRQRARFRARIVICVALQLIGEGEAAPDPDIAAIVETEVRRVEQAEGIYSPDWLGSAGELYGRIDYSDFQPHGYYLRSEMLKRYFRTIRWLQSIPFRPDSDDELLAIMLLAKTLTSPKSAQSDDRRTAESYLRCRRDLFGRKDDQDLLFASGILKDRPSDLDAVRQRLPSAGGAPQKKIGQADSDLARASLYIISPTRLPDEEFFRRREKTQGFKYTEPSGLEICALLGSAYARSQLDVRLPQAYRQSLLAEIESFKQEFVPDSLYSQYLNAVAALLDSPEPDAPAFTRKQAWKAKSCNAALAGWVQMRKLLPVNQRPPKDTVEGIFTEVPTGFVEPDPEFFDRLGELSERVPDILGRCGALPAPADLFAAQLREFDRLLQEGRFPAGVDDAEELTPEEQSVVERSLTILSMLEDFRIAPGDKDWQREEIRAAAAYIVDALARGEYDQDSTYQALVIETGMDLRGRWQQLRSISRRLEVMAHKQLRGVAFNEKEQYFLTDFGTALAAVMLYSGDSYRRPRDDAPVAFAYFFDPRSKKRLHAAVARPREIIVAYPFGGKHVVCRGAVLPFYEFIAAADFTDEQWRKRLDSDERPSPLRWLDPLMLPGDPKKSWRRIEARGTELEDKLQ